MVLGTVMLGVEWLSLTAEERTLLCHPHVGGVILFTRNYESPEQVAALTAALHALRDPPLLIAVDHEGGRVQRFREGFTRLPHMRGLGTLYETDPALALRRARVIGWLLAVELRAVGVDFSFAPVLDVDHGLSSIIGDRAFHRDPEIIVALAHAFTTGLRKGGMGAVGKHFPGHGGIVADSHLELPIDRRTFQALEECDLIPFARLIREGLEGIMPAHVLYASIDPQPAGFSPFWLRRVLRQRLGFEGIIFSDDLDMAGAQAAGSPPERALAALEAGCDMVLSCNDRAAAIHILDGLRWPADPVLSARLERLRGRGHYTRKGLQADALWQEAAQWVKKDGAHSELDVP